MMNSGKVILLLFAIVTFPSFLRSQVLESGFAFDDPTTSYTISLDASLATPLLNIESSWDL